jgi:hypothetical protein
MIEHHCIICSMFAAFRYMVRFYPLDSSWGTPTDWELSLIGKEGDSFLLDLLHRLAELGGELGIGPIHRDDLRRYPVFVKALIDKTVSVQTPEQSMIPPVNGKTEMPPGNTPTNNSKSVPIADDSESGLEAFVHITPPLQPPSQEVSPHASSCHVLAIKQTADAKWNDVIKIAEILLTRPNVETTAKEIWQELYPGQIVDERVRQIISRCITVIRNLLKLENTGWNIPQRQYIVLPNSENPDPDTGKLQLLLLQLKISIGLQDIQNGRQKCGDATCGFPAALLAVGKGD